MSYIHPEREEFLPDAVLESTPLPVTADPPRDSPSDPPEIWLPPWSRQVDRDYSWGAPTLPPSRLRDPGHGDADYSWDPDIQGPDQPPATVHRLPAEPPQRRAAA